MAKGMKPLASILIIAGCTGITAVGGLLFVRAQKKTLDAIEQGAVTEANAPGNAIRSFLTAVCKEDYEGLYETSQHTDPTLDSKDSYEAALKQKFAGMSAEEILYYPVDTESEIQTYTLANGDTTFAFLKLYEQEGTWKVSMPIPGNQTITVEVPLGTTLKDGTLISSNVKADYFDPYYSETQILDVDLYELDGLLGTPSLTDSSGNPLSLVQNVATGNYVAGTPVEDSALEEQIIAYGEALAAYPAQDTGLNSVTSVSDPSTLWYQRYVTLQNNWFSYHETSDFSNAQVLAITQPDENTMLAHVVFDYHAKNTAEDLERTWNIGYQLTLTKRNGTWIICNTAIDNELNPNSIPAE